MPSSSCIIRISDVVEAPRAKALTDRNALQVYQVVQRVFNELRQMVQQMWTADSAQIGVVQILRYSSEEERPSEDLLQRPDK